MSPASVPHRQRGRQTPTSLGGPWGSSGPQEGGQCQGRGQVLREGCCYYWKTTDIVGWAPGVLLTNCMTPDKWLHLFLEATSLSRLHLEGGGGGGPQDPTVTSTRNSPVLANFLSFLFSQYPYDSGGFFFLAIRGDPRAPSYMSKSQSIEENDLIPFHLPLWEVIIFNLTSFLTLLTLQFLLFNFPSDGGSPGQESPDLSPQGGFRNHCCRECSSARWTSRRVSLRDCYLRDDASLRKTQTPPRAVRGTSGCTSSPGPPSLASWLPAWC